MAADISRRQFFRLGLGDVTSSLRPRQDGDGSSRAAPYRPPGALPEDEFLSTCERCHKCVEVCPDDVIGLLGPAAGPAENTPVLEPDSAPCRWCTDLHCVDSCPSGALQYGPHDRVAPIGKAVLDLATCLTAEGIACDECAAVCPSDIRAIAMVGMKPQLVEERCVGCGLCSYHCPSTPTSIRVVAADR